MGTFISPAAWAAAPGEEKNAQLTPLQLTLLDQLAVKTLGEEKDAPSAPMDTMLLAKASPPTVRDRTVNVTTPEYWTRVARFLPESERTAPQNIGEILAKAYVVRSPKARGAAPDLKRYRPDAVDSTEAPQDAAPADSASPAPTQESATPEAVSQPAAPVTADAATTVAQGDAYLEANRLREAAHAYFTVVNEWPDSPESASCDNVMNALAWDVERNAVDLGEMRRFTDELPAAQDCKSDKALYWMVAAQQMTGENLAKAGLKEDARAYLERGRDGALAAMREMPESPYQIFFPGHYLRSCRNMGKEALGDAVENLKGVVRAQKTANVLKFAARVELALSQHKDYNDVTEALLQCGSTLDELPGSDAERIMADDTAATANIQAHVAFCKGYVLYQTSHFGQARRIFNDVAALYPENQRMADASMYMSAYLSELLSTSTPQTAVDAYSAYIEKSQGGDYLAMGLSRLAGVYERSGQLSLAAQVLQRMAELYPDKEWTANVARAEKECEAAVKAGMEDRIRVERLRGAQGETLCGPFAVALLLQSRGITADVATLAQQADSGAGGTNLYGLRKAAGIFGVGLHAVRTADLKTIPAPAIAYMEPDHFVFIRSVDADTVLIEDASGQRSMAIGDFMQVSPRLLVLADAAGNAAEITQEEMEAVQGRCDEFFDDLLQLQ